MYSTTDRHSFFSITSRTNQFHRHDVKFILIQLHAKKRNGVKTKKKQDAASTLLSQGMGKTLIPRS
jgi:hypothetical protein